MEVVLSLFAIRERESPLPYVLVCHSGCDEIGRYVKGTNAILLERACRSGLPFGVEEVKGSKSQGRTNQLDIGDLIIDVTNGSRSTNMNTLTMKPKTVPVVASNFAMDDIERSVHSIIMQ